MENDSKTRKVERGDSRRIWEIRNHPEARKISNNTEEISFEKHEAWFENKYFNNEDNFCFVLENNGEVIGYCRFDLDKDNNYIVSIAIDADHHGRGLGSVLLGGSLDKMDKNKDIIAETKKENIASIKLFKKNNFEVYREDDSSYYFKLKNIR